MASLEELQKNIIKFRDDRDWAQFNNPKDSSISLLLEATELLEHFQWKNGEELEQYLNKHKDEIADELSDILYWVLLVAYDLKIDLSSHQPKKLAEAAKKYPVEKSKGSHQKYTHYQTNNP